MCIQLRNKLNYSIFIYKILNSSTALLAVTGVIFTVHICDICNIHDYGIRNHELADIQDSSTGYTVHVLYMYSKSEIQG